ncbi:MAG: glutamine--fructose-6-phosphate transaminase (isomerizing) [Thermoanaerobaculum sp.]|nr:glutamine--fructose-6-phosphate transaminase (isomerizing) [Thermoanaerobaculum sp.]MDW7968541.1 glutamine--fructose-6-phosphate transaminase (isomerizing) [Thermoanaerobaculum sp.]
MCGIFGIVFDHDRPLGEILTGAAKRLSYRGYDSVGAAAIDSSGRIDLRKAPGKVEEVAEKLGFVQLHGLRGICQLRWATFGAPSYENSQPHLDSDGDLVGAHNGNVVNNAELRRQFLAEGMVVRGTNDGESCVHAVERYVNRGYSLPEAVRAGYRDLAGDFAFVISNNRENMLVAVKKGSGLVIGVGPDFTCCSSDLPSILPLTRRVIPVEDGEMAVLRPHSVELFRVEDGAPISRPAKEVGDDMGVPEKGGFPHFMLKEIHEQAAAARELVHLLEHSEHLPALAESMAKARRVFLVGSGSSYHACLVGSHFFSHLAGVLAIPALPQQFVEQFGPALGPGDVALFVSQSGETKDVLNALNFGVEQGVTALGLVNVLGSTLTRKVEHFLPLACGWEISVPATKTYTNQVIALIALASRTGGGDLGPLPAASLWLEQIIREMDGTARALARQLAKTQKLFILGYGLGHGIALEGALKIKEVTGLPCEGMFSSEFKHGPLAMVEHGTPVLFTTSPAGCQMLTNHVTEVTCRGGYAIVIAPECENLRAEASLFIPFGVTSEVQYAVVGAIPFQLFAYHLAVALGYDPDYPRNLSKTITVD